MDVASIWIQHASPPRSPQTPACQIFYFKLQKIYFGAQFSFYSVLCPTVESLNSSLREIKRCFELCRVSINVASGIVLGSLHIYHTRSSCMHHCLPTSFVSFHVFLLHRFIRYGAHGSSIFCAFDNCQFHFFRRRDSGVRGYRKLPIVEKGQRGRHGLLTSPFLPWIILAENKW